MKALYATLLLVAVSLVSGCDANVEQATPAQKDIPSTSETPASPALHVRALSLFNDYQANEVAADAKYKGHTLFVTGVVAGIKKDVLDKSYVNLQTSNEFEGVEAYLRDSETQRASTLVKGKTVTVRCVGAGMTVGSPILDECTIL